MLNWLNPLKRWFGAATAYQPGTGRIVPVSTRTGAGVDINEITVLSIPAFFHGIRLYGQTLGNQKWDLIHHLDNNSIEIARKHPVHALLHNRPNEFQSSAEFRETIIGHALVYGGGFAYIERNGNYRPTALLPLLPDRTRPQLDQGKFNYLTIVNGKQITLEPDEVFHIRGFSMNGTSGVPLVQIMKDTLGLTKAQEEFACKFYGNGANMGGFFEMPGSLTVQAQQNLKDSMRREYGGLGNAFKHIFLEDGVKYHQLGTDPDKAQFIEGRQFQLSEIARVLGLPCHLLYDLSRSTNNNIEHQGIEVVTYSFAPWAGKLCDEANNKLLYESEKDDYETRIDLTPLMKGDALTQAQTDQIRFNTLAITPNEIRAKDGRNPIDGGNDLYINQAYLPLSISMQKALMPSQPLGLPNPATPATDQNIGINTDADEGDDSVPGNPSAGEKDVIGPAVPDKLVDDDLGRSILAPVIHDAIGRIVRRESKAISAAASKFNREQLRTWFIKFAEDESKHIDEVLQPVIRALEASGSVWDASYSSRHLATLSQGMEAVITAPEAQTDTALADLMKLLEELPDKSLKGEV
jgi:HK97 family phage portal protein